VSFGTQRTLFNYHRRIETNFTRKCSLYGLDTPLKEHSGLLDRRIECAYPSPMTVCILTNNAALFPSAAFGNGRSIRTLTLAMQDGCIVPPTADDFSRAYKELEQEFGAILVLMAPESILPGASAAHIAAQSHGGTANVSVLDSQQIGPGLGLLAQIGSQKAAAGASLQEVQECIRAIIPFLFTLICPDTAPPLYEEQNDPATASLTDLSSVVPIYSLEEGCLAPYKKVRTRRHLLETLQEFLEEFERPQQLAYFRGYTTRLRARQLREAASGLFPGTPFTEMELNAPLSALFGAQAVGITVLEMPV
jgi:fatty acid-binding protein DegV